MGDIKKPKKKYATPSHPWQKERIDEEKILSKDYGLANKKEIWRMSSKLKHFKDRAKALTARRDKQADIEASQLLTRLRKYGLIQETATLDNILELNTKDLMERRLQTILARKGLARSLKQARQFITHNHIMVGGKLMTVPSYITSIEEEAQITFMARSSLSNPDHPERAFEKKVEDEKAEKKKKGRREPVRQLRGRRRESPRRDLGRTQAPIKESKKGSAPKAAKGGK